MTDEMKDRRFEGDLRSVLADAVPAAVPAALRDFVADLPRRTPVRRGWSSGRAAFTGLAMAAVVIIAVAAAAVALRPFGDLPIIGGPAAPTPTQPQSLHLRYQVLPALGIQPGPNDLEAIAAVLRARLDATGVVGSLITTASPDSISVDVAVPADDVSTADRIRALLGATGRLDFVPLGSDVVQAGAALPPGRHPVLFSGDQVAEATVASDQTGLRTVDFTLRPEAASLFAAYTGQHIGEFFAIVLDGNVVTAPAISSPIPDGKVQVSAAGEGGWPLDEAQRIVTIVRTGALPFPVREVASNVP